MPLVRRVRTAGQRKRDTYLGQFWNEDEEQGGEVDSE